MQVKLSRIRDKLFASLLRMHLYDRLLAKYLRKKRGDETLRAFSRKIGLTHGTLHRIENLQQSLTIGKLGYVMEKLGCSWYEIFGEAKISPHGRREPSMSKSILPKKVTKRKTSKTS